MIEIRIALVKIVLQQSEQLKQGRDLLSPVRDRFRVARQSPWKAAARNAYRNLRLLL
jgi:hypothetical protein